MKSKKKIDLELICFLAGIAFMFGMFLALNSQLLGRTVFETVSDTLIATIFIIVGSAIILTPVVVLLNYLDKRRRKELDQQ